MQKSRIPTMIEELAKKCLELPQPIHVIAVCSGGRTVGSHIYKYFTRHNVKANYFEAWIDIKDGKGLVRSTDFEKEDYIGTVLIAEDVIWSGTAVTAVRKMLSKIKRKKTYLAVLLDMNKKADFSIFS